MLTKEASAGVIRLSLGQILRKLRMTGNRDREWQRQKQKKSTNSLLEISTLSVNYWTKFWWGDETEYHIDILDIVFMNLLFPLPVVKRFSKIVHLLCTWSGMFLYLTSLSLMSFTDSSHSDAESIQKNHGKTNTDKQFDHVMCFGTFDIFHPGHQFYLSEAQKFAWKMTIVIARDARVILWKWKTPIDDEDTRLIRVQEAFPDAHVILWDSSDIFAPIRTLVPDLLAFGYDQRVPEERIRELFPTIEIVRIGWYETDKWKSSLLRSR